MKLREKIGDFTLYVILIVSSIIFLFPFFWMLSTSLKSIQQVFTYPPVWFPVPPHWLNYRDALFSVFPFMLYFKNTLIISAGVVIGTLVSCSLTAYGFARLNFWGKNFLFMVLVSTMMVPLIVRLVPLFLFFKSFGWINTYYPLVVPAFFGTPFFIFLMRQFYMSIPEELSDSARIDGCSEFSIWRRIFLPLSKPVMAVVIIFAFQQTWNDFLQPLIFINDDNKKTVILGIYNLIGTGGTEQYWNLVMAVTVLAVAPVVILFFAAQKVFVQGITVTGIKG